MRFGTKFCLRSLVVILSLFVSEVFTNLIMKDIGKRLFVISHNFTLLFSMNNLGSSEPSDKIVFYGPLVKVANKALDFKSFIKL